MNRLIVCTLLTAAAGVAATAPKYDPSLERVIWRAPHTLTTSDWVWGPGGQQKAPTPPFQFVKENMGGTNPKVNVRDARGALWIVKFGGEVHAEVFASRLLYAVGYSTEPTHFVAEGVITGATSLKRAKPFIGKEGHFRDARFKLRDERIQSYASHDKWTWTSNPFAGSREMNGLRILLMLASNWDTKDARDGEGSNTAVFLRHNDGPDFYWYAMTDWGATFGSWGGFFQRSRWNSEAYVHQTPHFVRGVKVGAIVWGFQGKHGEDITNGISTGDVRWLLPYLTAIHDEQLRVGLQASGATPAGVKKFSSAIRNRIAQLERVAESQ